MSGILTPDDLARRWATTRPALAAMRYRGNGPAFFKRGRRVLYRLADVEAYEADTHTMTGVA